MSFLYPLGLLGLIGIPILIIVYIIKSKYTEQTVASTYLWTLSERFLKRKRRPSPLAGIISLILQILAVTLISLLIAHPIITIPNSANEYCFILDGSGSMHMEVSDTEKGMTRFEAGKQVIREKIDAAIDGSIFTLIHVGDTTNVVYEKIEDKEQALLLLDELNPAYMTASFTDAIGLTQGYFNENTSLLAYLITDETYDSAENIEVINVATPVENYSLSDISHIILGGKLTVTGKVTSYENDASVTVQVYLDGEDTPSATQSLQVKANEPSVFSLTADADAFSIIHVKIPEADALAYDNEYIIHNVKSENSYNTLIISDRPFFLESVLKSLLNAKVDVMSPEEYDGRLGYGLYIFDTVDASTMSVLPSDGTVWMVNVNGSVEGAGYTVQGEVALDKAEILSPATSSSSATQALVQGMRGDEIYVTRYIKCGFYRNFTTLLSYKGSPIVFAGTNEHGNRQVVFAFDLHDSNLPLLYDFSVMTRNLVGFSFPDMIDRTTYECGESANVNVITNCESIRVESPSGEVSYLKTDVASDVIHLKEVGIYTVTMTVSGSARQFSIWSAMPQAECDPTLSQGAVSLQGIATNNGFAGRYDPLSALFIALAVVFLADWMVYCYEKYQLR